jgi:hypothetical protein
MILRQAENEEKKKLKQGINKVSGTNNNNKNSNVPKWKKQSEEFRRILKGARNPEVPSYEKNGGKKGQNIIKKQTEQQYSISDDYTHCSICNRKYNEQAYNKHLPTCQRKQKENMLKGNYGNSGNTGYNNNQVINYGISNQDNQGYSNQTQSYGNQYQVLNKTNGGMKNINTNTKINANIIQKPNLKVVFNNKR